MTELSHEPLVYIAGPISNGGSVNDPEAQKRAALEAITYGEMVLAAGMTPLIPHLSVFWLANSPECGIEYEDWMRMDFNYIYRCDALLRIPGESKGADREVAFARENDVFVAHSIEELEAWAAKGEWKP